MLFLNGFGLNRAEEVQAAGDEPAELFASSCWHQHAHFLSRWRAPRGVRGTATGLGAPRDKLCLVGLSEHTTAKHYVGAGLAREGRREVYKIS